MTIFPKDFEDEDDDFAAAFDEDFGIDFEELLFGAAALGIAELLDAFTGKMAERDELDDDQDLVDDGLIFGGTLQSSKTAF